MLQLAFILRVLGEAGNRFRRENQHVQTEDFITFIRTASNFQNKVFRQDHDSSSAINE